MKHLQLYVCCIFLLSITFGYKSTQAQSYPADTINTKINTGNPNFPFPQFLEYNSGKTLAKNNAEGVTHADMEKAMREGYQIMMHRCIYTGQTYGGVKYIKYNPPVVPANYGTFVSEGDGYAMLAAAYFADKAAFDGLWMWVHDNRLSKVKQYYNCANLRGTYTYAIGMPGWDNDETTWVGSTSVNSATDGDVDIAMALLLAHKQWGDNMGVNDACGVPISYKQEALKMINALVDTLKYTVSPMGAAAGTVGYMSGDIGIDGYIKSGNTWGELTNWRYSAANTVYPWAKPKPDPIQVTSVYTDYMAPAYFNEFATFLAANGGTPWQINQYKRAEASSDWIVGQMYTKGYIASSGNYTVNDNGSTTTFGTFSAGEDFRLPWRTILNYVWHGNPTTTWDPVTHQTTATPNNFEYNMGIRHADFLKYPRTVPNPITSAYCGKLGASPDPSCPNWRGVAQLKQNYTPGGAVNGNYGTNYSVGAGSPAAVASGDLDIIAEIYRQSELLWDDASGLSSGMTDDQRYIKSTPKYFHDWYRILGMLTTSGNLHAPAVMTPIANMKVYMAVDKTFAYEGDIITYTVSYRNYGTVDATGVAITTVLDSDYQFISASNGATHSGGVVTRAVGTVPGFKTATGITPTTGSYTITVRVKPAPVHQRVCLTSTITSSNAPSWTSNEFPNNASYTMERNCVDLLIDRVLLIEKTTDRAIMNPGDIVNFKLEFENKSGSNLWLNGGRDRVILSYGFNHPTNGTSFYQFYRIWHSAPEAYINLGNYRVSYFLNDGAAIGQYNAATNPTGWDTYVDNQSDLNKYGYNPLTLPANQQLRFTYQRIPWGSDAYGSWNQRIVTQFANVLTSPSTHIYDKLDSDYLIHKGVKGPGFTRTRFESKPSSDLTSRIADDWSYGGAARDENSLDGQAKRFAPVSPTYTNFATNFAPVVVNNYSKDVCDANVLNYERVLVEEFDGYTWRRIAGLGPLPGRETYNVVVTDSIPIELTWNGFTDDNAVGITATYTPLASNPKFSGYVKWSIPVMLVGEKGDLAYKAIAKDPPCPSANKSFINAGWIWSSVDSPDSSAVGLTVTCNPVPPTPPTETSLDKTANKTTVTAGDVITYSLEFKNTDGTIVNGVFGGSAVASDWQALGSGVIPNIANNPLNLDANGTGNPSQGSTGYAFGHKKSHGKNGTMDITIDPTNSSQVGLIFRHTAGTPGQAGFAGLRLMVTPNPAGNNTINFELFNNTTSIFNQTNISYPGSPDPFTIRAQLIDDKLYIWVNDFTGAPLKVISGITNLNAGYAGIYSNGSQQKITAYSTHFDSSFDLVMTDPVPSQLTSVTAISNSGTLTAGTITWPTVPGPILAGTSTVRTFQATVNTCTNFITNIGRASVYGIANIQSQYVVNCAVTVPVEFMYLTATKVEGAVALSWATASEYNNNHFNVERSEDGIHFTTIAVVRGAGISQSIRSYSYTDYSGEAALLYYRITQVDYDGNSSSTNIVKVASDGNVNVLCYPNPFNRELTVQILSSEEQYSWNLSNSLGQVLLSGEDKQGTKTFVLGEELSSGVYFLKVKTRSGIKVMKVDKE